MASLDGENRASRSEICLLQNAGSCACNCNDSWLVPRSYIYPILPFRHTKIGGDANTLQNPANRDKIVDSFEAKGISAWLDRGNSSSSQTFLEEVDVSSLVVADRHYFLVEIFGETSGSEIILSKFLEPLRIEGILKMLESESTIFWSTSKQIIKED